MLTCESSLWSEENAEGHGWKTGMETDWTEPGERVKDGRSCWELRQSSVTTLPLCMSSQVCVVSKMILNKFYTIHLKKKMGDERSQSLWSKFDANISIQCPVVYNVSLKRNCWLTLSICWLIRISPELVCAAGSLHVNFSSSHHPIFFLFCLFISVAALVTWSFPPTLQGCWAWGRLLEGSSSQTHSCIFTSCRLKSFTIYQHWAPTVC
jgi:hypothetical protein